MTPIATIVEGDGEVAALPIVLRRLAEWLSPALGAVEVPTPIRVRRDRFLNRDEEFRRMLLLAAAKCGEAGWILVLLDADDDCPAELAPEILTRAQAVVPHRRVSVVLANREFEAWFLAGAESLDGKRGFSCAKQETSDPEAVRNAKGWLSERMGAGRYRETTDQPAFATLLDLRLAHDRSRSFRKLCGEWAKRVA
jgi:hypothetical protein